MIGRLKLHRLKRREARLQTVTTILARNSGLRRAARVPAAEPPLGPPNPRNPRHFDSIEGRRNSVSDTLCAKIRVLDTKNTVSDTFCAKDSA